MDLPHSVYSCFYRTSFVGPFFILPPFFSLFPVLVHALLLYSIGPCVCVFFCVIGSLEKINAKTPTPHPTHPLPNTLEETPWVIKSFFFYFLKKIHNEACTVSATSTSLSFFVLFCFLGGRLFMCRSGQ